MDASLCFCFGSFFFWLDIMLTCYATMWTCWQCPTVLFKSGGFLLFFHGVQVCKSRMSWCTSSEFDAQTTVWWWKQKKRIRTESKLEKKWNAFMPSLHKKHGQLTFPRHLGLKILGAPGNPRQLSCRGDLWTATPQQSAKKNRWCLMILHFVDLASTLYSYVV